MESTAVDADYDPGVWQQRIGSLEGFYIFVSERLMRSILVGKRNEHVLGIGHESKKSYWSGLGLGKGFTEVLYIDQGKS